MPAKLFCKYGQLKGSSFDIGEEARIGRAGSCSIPLQHKLISANHARIYRDPETHTYMLEDLKSSNGTVLDGKPVTQPERLEYLHVINFGGASDFIFQDMERCAIRHGQTVPVEDLQNAVRAADADAAVADAQPKKAASTGNTTVGEDGEVRTPSFIAKLGSKIFSWKNRDSALINDPQAAIGQGEKPKDAPQVANQSTEQEQRPTPAGKPRSNTNIEFDAVITPQFLADQDSEPAPGSKASNQPAAEVMYRLTITNLKKEPLVFDLGEGEHVVGRAAGISISLDSHEISRRHAVIRISQGKAHIRDLESTNHTFVNNKIINQEVAVKPGDSIGFSKLQARFELKP